MAGRLQDKVIVIAGGGGIGDVMAETYFREGAKVVVGDINGEHAAAVAKEIDPSGARLIGAKVDGGDEASVHALVDLAVSKFGRLDGFHANFALFTDGLMPEGAVDLPLDIYDNMTHVNARGCLLCTRAAVPAMIKSGGGSIVYTTSGAAYAGEKIRVAYAMSKAAGHALMRHVASRYGREGIRANVIAPGMIVHKNLQKSMPDDRKQQALRGVHTTRIGDSPDIAAAGVYLLSDESGFVTGQVIAVDGSNTMRQ
jgi:NAD(P)-dependent dehydrogenase (short-subunit alcohol dehydrogenase family)